MGKNVQIASPVGRPTKYKPEYCNRIVEYFDIPAYHEDGDKKVPNDPRFLYDFARKIRVNIDTIYTWANVHPEFSDALKTVKKLQEKHLAINGFYGNSHPTFTIFMLKNICGWRDDNNERSNLSINFNTNVLNLVESINEDASKIATTDASGKKIVHQEHPQSSGDLPKETL